MDLDGAWPLKKQQIIWMKLHKMVLFGHEISIVMPQNTSKAQRKLQPQSNTAYMSFKVKYDYRSLSALFFMLLS